MDPDFEGCSLCTSPIGWIPSCQWCGNDLMPIRNLRGMCGCVLVIMCVCVGDVLHDISTMLAETILRSYRELADYTYCQAHVNGYMMPYQIMINMSWSNRHKKWLTFTFLITFSNEFIYTYSLESISWQYTIKLLTWKQYMWLQVLNKQLNIFNGIVKYYNISIPNALEILQSCTKPSFYS